MYVTMLRCPANEDSSAPSSELDEFSNSPARFILSQETLSASEAVVSFMHADDLGSGHR